jgi:hypothetical protein
MEERMTAIAFVGLRHVGGPMGANLARAGHTVTAVADAEAVVTMLPHAAGHPDDYSGCGRRRLRVPRRKRRDSKVDLP